MYILGEGPLRASVSKEAEFDEPISRGSRGKAARRVQEWLELQRLGVTIDGQFGPVTAVDNVTFAVAAGEAVALWGANGAGKTTIIKLLTRLYDVDRGAVRVDGIDVILPVPAPGALARIAAQADGDGRRALNLLELAVEAVFKSWMGKRAVDYRREFNISRGMANGTAVNICTMVYGNMGDDSATGVAFTRDPATGSNRFFGEYMLNAQGEDVVAGIRTPRPLRELRTDMPEIYKELEKLNSSQLLLGLKLSTFSL